MRTAVTGAAGFIGSHLCDRLLADGHQVVGIDAFTDYYSRMVKESNLQSARRDPNFALWELDLVEDELDEALRGVDVVFHLAGRCGIRPGRRNRIEHFVRDNVVATERLMEALRRHAIRRFVYASTFAVYGDSAWVPTKESSLPEPVSPYGITKLAAEHLVRYHAHRDGLPAVVLRYFTVYGPRQRPDMAIASFMQSLVDGREAQINGGGTQTRDFTYVSDVVDATIRAGSADAAGMIINIGGGSRTTVNDVVATVESVAGGRVRRQTLPPMPGDQRDSAASINLARRQLGWEPRVSLRKGIASQWAWFTAAGAGSAPEPAASAIARL